MCDRLWAGRECEVLGDRLAEAKAQYNAIVPELLDLRNKHNDTLRDMAALQRALQDAKVRLCEVVRGLC